MLYLSQSTFYGSFGISLLFVFMMCLLLAIIANNMNRFNNPILRDKNVSYRSDLNFVVVLASVYYILKLNPINIPLDNLHIN